ncbi:hypothetical protein L1049_020296 [Liquidambar formosana]|uniref:RING-type E3 ubiquitin transferase n=1 Tax=Liquidambar formosana TaxID=63359 RepID=A0AAP0XAM8_LIQFO
MSSDFEVKNHGRPIIAGVLGFIKTANHGLVSLTLVVLLLSPAIPFAGAQPSPDTRPDPYAYNRFSPSMAIIIVVLIAALFFMGFFSIYLRNCTEARTGSVRPLAGNATGRSRRGSRGLDAAVIETFPTFAYSAVRGLKIGKGALECAVCLNEFEDDETLRLLPKCDHVFHPDCIDAWLTSHTTCPVCRANLAVPADGAAADDVHTIDIHDSDGELGESTHGQETNELQNSTSVPVAEEQTRDHSQLLPGGPEVIKPSRSLNQSRRSRSIKARIFSKFPRSHSTGHSLIQPGENFERFTLRLPDEVRKQLVNPKLNRATSLVVLPREGSSRRGYRTGEGSSRGRFSKRLDRLPTERWVFSMAPPFFTRTASVSSPKVVANAGEGSSSSSTSMAPKIVNAV